MRIILVCKCMWENSKEAKRRGQANAQSVVQGQYQNILELGHSNRERYSMAQKRNRKEVKGRGEVGAITRNQYLDCWGQGGHGSGYPNDGDIFVKGKKRKRLLTV